MGLRLTDHAFVVTSYIEQSATGTAEAKLALLQPLADAKILDRCREQASREVRQQPGENKRRARDQQILNIQQLGKAWRQTLAQMPPFQHIVFDLTLPKQDQDANAKVYWESGIPDGKEAVGLRRSEVASLIMTIATATKMRLRGNVSFEMVLGEEHQVFNGLLEHLPTRLDALSQMGKTKAETAL
ncbi:hypothetical protein HJFPF1_08582 [Paramyrothecium foliicola]|nr:hypothetical protein HJFPF1_08582 [Paramyrothecium foliicola]